MKTLRESHSLEIQNLVDQHKQQVEELISSIKAEEASRMSRFEMVIIHQNKEIADYKLQITNFRQEAAHLNSQISEITLKLSKAESDKSQLEYDLSTYT
jgi:uncharacterized coiled-coil protein SlyX